MYTSINVMTLSLLTATFIAKTLTPYPSNSNPNPIFSLEFRLLNRIDNVPYPASNGFITMVHTLSYQAAPTVNETPPWTAIIQSSKKTYVGLSDCLQLSPNGHQPYQCIYPPTTPATTMNHIHAGYCMVLTNRATEDQNEACR